jgi:hypothetical protein
MHKDPNMPVTTGYPEITVIIVSVNYADMLEQTLSQVAKLFTNVVVLTSHDDEATIKICHENSVRSIEMDIWKKDGATFNKSGAINLAMEQLNAESALEWVLLLDADIYFQDNFEIDISSLKPQSLYGVRRRMCVNEQDWDAFKAGDKCAEEFPLCNAVKVKDGWIWNEYYSSNPAAICGYFQLWNYKNNEWAQAVPQTKNAAKYDVLFAFQFGEAHRHNLPTSDVVHLGEDQVNWNGRVSSIWGSSEPAKPLKKGWLRKWW